MGINEWVFHSLMEAKVTIKWASLSTKFLDRRIDEIHFKVKIVIKHFYNMTINKSIQLFINFKKKSQFNYKTKAWP